MCIPKRSYSIISPIKIIKHKPVIVKYQSDLVVAIENGAYFTGQVIILFTMFYCTLQWNMYRNINKKKDKK